MTAELIVGRHPDGSRRFVAVDRVVSIEQGVVSVTRLGAWLKPYPDAEAALAALTGAGCSIEGGDG